MPNPSQYSKVTHNDITTSKVDMALKCGCCGKVATYKVGHIILDPEYVQEIRHEDPTKSLRLLHKVSWAKWVSFTGYFLCRHCGSGGPWEFSSAARHQMVQMMIHRAVTGTSSEVFFGRVTLFDGTSPRTPYEGAEHLKRLLANDPNDAYLWNRLGNVYVGADEPDLALPAFQKAVALNPRDVESLHSLGAYWFDRGNDDSAAHCLNQVLHLCRDVTWHNPRMKEKVVQDALERLLEIQRRTGGRLKVILPPVQPDLGVVQYELSKEADMRRLVHLLLTGTPLQNTPPAQGQEKRQPFATAPALRFPQSNTPKTAQRVGRNDACPCGSGRKFKHCCHRQ